MVEMTGGEALASQLVQEGVRHVFGVPGVQLDNAVDGLYGVKDELSYLATRHEQAAAYMADGYARASGRTGVCMVVPGPGVLNAGAGLVTAYACSSPLLFLAGQIPLPAIGRGFGLLHEIPGQSDILAKLTKWSRLVTDPAAVPQGVNEACAAIWSGRTRPCALEVPPDVLAASAAIELVDAASPAPLAPDEDEVIAAAKLISNASFPVIYAGGGVVAAGAADALTRFAELVEAPVTESQNGRGAITSRHRLALPGLGFRQLREKADVVIVVGSRFMAGTSPVPTRDAKVVFVNADANDFLDRRVDAPVHADARLGLEALTEELSHHKASDRSTEIESVRRWCNEQTEVVAEQAAYLQVIRNALPDEGIFVSELTQLGYVAPIVYPVFAPRTFIGAGYQGTLGFGFPTALGAKVARPDVPVVSITGDGGFGWCLSELATAHRYHIALVTIVFRDELFGNVRRIQRERFGARYLGSDLDNPDFVRLAESFGVTAYRAESASKLEPLLKEALGANEPIVIECPVPEFPSPWPLITEAAQPATTKETR